MKRKHPINSLNSWHMLTKNIVTLRFKIQGEQASLFLRVMSVLKVYSVQLESLRDQRADQYVWFRLIVWFSFLKSFHGLRGVCNSISGLLAPPGGGLQHHISAGGKFSVCCYWSNTLKLYWQNNNITETQSVQWAQNNMIQNTFI